MSTKVSKRIKFKDLPDWFRGRYFLFTLPYALFYLIGAGVGYSRTGNLFCLLGSGGIGVLFTLMGIAHTLDYYRGANLESWYVGIPFSKCSSLWTSQSAIGALILVIFNIYSDICLRGDSNDLHMGAWRKV
jgi:hypothetical protein